MSILADSVFKSARVNGLIADLKREILSAQEQITGVKPAHPELAASFQKYLEKLQSLRGRNLFYPYVGSGLGRGPYVELGDGSIKIDLINEIGVILFGHTH